MQLTPDGVHDTPQAFTGSFFCYPGISYTITSYAYSRTSFDALQVGVDWFDLSGNYAFTTPFPGIGTPQANAWNTVTATIVATAGIWRGNPFCGLANNVPIPGGHLLDIGTYITTPYS